jgi:hypothetical protein
MRAQTAEQHHPWYAARRDRPSQGFSNLLLAAMQIGCGAIEGNHQIGAVRTRKGFIELLSALERRAQAASDWSDLMAEALQRI